MILVKKSYITLKENGFIITFYKIFYKLNLIYFNKLRKKSKWKHASYIGKRIIALYPEELWFYEKQIECYRNLKEYDLENRLLEKYINEQFNSFSKTISEIKKEISSNYNLESEYKLLGGFENVGFMEHSAVSKKYLTKIILNSGWRENTFYSKIYPLHPRLQKVTPKMINLESDSSTNMNFITTEKIEGIIPEFNDGVIKKVIEITQILNSIKQTNIKHLFPMDEFKNLDHLKVINSEVGVFGNLAYFNEINKELPNRLVIYQLLSELENTGYSPHSIRLIKRLEKVILENKMYKKLFPNKHYSFRHGDLTLNNIIQKIPSGELKLLDWGNSRMGPKWFDITGFLALTKISFNDINKLYLQGEFSSCLDPVEKLFFIYTLIVIWFNVLSKKEFGNNYDIYLEPAIKQLETIERIIINTN